MVSVSLEFSDEVVRAARQEGVSLEDFVRRCVQTQVAISSRDPFSNDDAVHDGPTPPDLSQNHDKYLYGEQS